jgi:GWxTD domain-containing protein
MAFLRCEDELMKKIAYVVLMAVVILSVSGLQAAEKMTPDIERWFEDVGPIITKTERSVFLKLQTNADRAKFTRFFWRIRDPYPDTAENEFRKEYEERVRFADQNFGHFSPKRGSQTDRGFFYLLLGPPLERHQYTTQSEIWPLELWFYRGEVEHGLPGYFYLIFYQPEGLGDFRLYSPTVEGPEKLAIPITGSAGMLSRAAAYNAVQKVSGELAAATMSYLPTDSSTGAGSFSSDLLIASVRSLPDKKFSDAYARTYMDYKDHIETEYSDSYFSSAFRVRPFLDRGQTFLHWSIEPERMDFGAQGDQIYAGFELVLRIEDAQGRTVHERTDEIPIRLTEEQYKAHARQPFAFQDLLAIIPGEYRALFLLKNKTAKSFSSFETRLTIVPADKTDRPAMTPPLLFYARSPVPDAQKDNLKAFVFGGRQYLVGARNDFTTASTLGVLVQVRPGAAGGDGSAPAFVLDLVSVDTGESVGTFPLTEARPAPGDPSILLVEGSVPLGRVKPGYYRAEVSMRSAEGAALLAEKENFIVMNPPAAVIPWVYARLHGPFPGPEHLKVLGAQYFMTGDYQRSRQAMERVLEGRDDADARLLMAKSLYGLGLYREALAQAARVHERANDRESAKVMALCYAGLKEWAPALVVLEELLAVATEIPVLNLAAEGYLALGQPDKALPLIQKSLSLVPDQPAVKAMEERARKKKDNVRSQP